MEFRKLDDAHKRRSWGRARTEIGRTLVIFLLVMWGAIGIGRAAEPAILRIPRVSQPPKLQDFLDGTARQAEARVSGFRQYEPGDGTPASQETTAYLSYDDKNLYVVFVCKDDPAKVRARLTRREDTSDDDKVVVHLDTFYDRRHAYSFFVNPLGVQTDALWTEGQGSDNSFDTVWDSDGRLTEDGYVVWMAIPFKSLRFPLSEVQTWGVALGRNITRNNEMSNWPYITQRMESYAGQFARLEGLERISPGRNLQTIPYFVGGQARYLDPLSPGGTAFRSETETRAGVDAKVIFRDALALDLALNPDFSQVESDEPQVTVNQRFEVFFPEKRPFFIENAGYFQTPISLFFSRRIADPQFGARLTGKAGRWNLGVLGMDDRSQGESLPYGDPLRGERAGVAVVRVQREFANQSTIGMFASSRDFASSYNRVFSLDTRLRLNPNWILTGQAMRSYSRDLDGTNAAGPAYWAELSHSGRHTSYAARYLDYSPDFRADLGFIPRVDVRKMEHYFQYYWKPEKGAVLLFGPDVTTSLNWNRQGQLQDWVVDMSFGADVRGPTGFGCRHVNAFELFQGIGFRRHNTDCGLNTQWLKWLQLSPDYAWGTGVNYFPAAGLAPFPVNSNNVTMTLTLRPTSHATFAQTYLYTRLTTAGRVAGAAVGADVLTNHIFRSKLNYQFTRTFSLRAIVDYNAILPNPSLVSLNQACLSCSGYVSTKRLTGDILFTYLLHPGTAVYVGYTERRENPIDFTVPPPQQAAGGPNVVTGRQFFVKLSYQFRF